jgi:antitoxin ParD1/3/4
MASVNLGDHFEAFAEAQIARGRYQNVSEVVRAALRLLEDHEMSLQERRAALSAKINAAWDDPSPSRPADEVFDRLEALHAEQMAARSDGRA